MLSYKYVDKNHIILVFKVEFVLCLNWTAFLAPSCISAANQRLVRHRIVVLLSSQRNYLRTKSRIHVAVTLWKYVWCKLVICHIISRRQGCVTVCCLIEVFLSLSLLIAKDFLRKYFKNECYPWMQISPMQLRPLENFILTLFTLAELILLEFLLPPFLQTFKHCFCKHCMCIKDLVTQTGRVSLYVLMAVCTQLTLFSSTWHALCLNVVLNT